MDVVHSPQSRAHRKPESRELASLCGTAPHFTYKEVLVCGLS